MQRVAQIGVVLAALALPAGAQTGGGRIGEVNTLWVVPERQVAWVEPLYCRRKDGGRLYQLDGQVVQRDLAQAAQNAITYLTDHPELAPGWEALWQRHDLYFWWPDPHQPRGGPSAGVAFAVAACSAMLDWPVRRDAAFTGGVGPDGAVLPVGGVPLKIPAALAAGIKTLCLPAASAPDWRTLPFNTARQIRLVALRETGDAFFEAFGLDGPDARRYDRVTTLWLDAREAIARRRSVAARLALDELSELVPNDLSAARLRESYLQTDMRQAALNLFADALQYDDDGLADVALQTARRAWSYADEATRREQAEFLARLEHDSLPPASRALLDRATTLADQGDLAAASHLLDELAAREPRHPVLARLEPQRVAYRAVAQLEAAARQRPDDVSLQDALAQACLKAAAPGRAADIYASLSQQQPSEPRWPVAEATVWQAAARPDRAAAILRAMQPRWPDTAAETAASLGLTITPPTLTATPVAQPGALLVVDLAAHRAGTAPDASAASPIVLEALLNGRPVARAEGAAARLVADRGRLAPGPAALVITATDPLGNQTTTELALTGLPVPMAARVGDGGVAGRPATYLARPGERWLVGPGTQLRCEAADWFGPGAGGFRLGDQTVTEPPRQAVWTATAPGRQAVPLVAGEARHELAVEVAEAPVRWVTPQEGEAVQGTVPIVVAAAGGETVELWVNGQPWQRGPADKPLTWQTTGLPAGRYRLSAVVEQEDGRLAASGELTVDLPAVGELTVDLPAVEDPQPAATEELRPAAVGAPRPAAELTAWLAPVSLPGLLAGAVTPHPAITPVAAREAVWFEAAPAAWLPLASPAAAELAIRLPHPAPPAGRLHLPPGQTLAFDDPPTLADLGGGILAPGPLATTVWAPPGPGTWTLGPLTLSVLTSPGLFLDAPAPALRLTAPVRFEITPPPAEPDGPITLLAGEAAWATWPHPPAAFWLDPAQMEPGGYPLRLVTHRPDGTIALSPPVVVEVE